MKMQAEQRIGAPRDIVFAALNDAEVLKRCIPGCETLEKTSDTDMTATVALKVGPVKARFNGSVVLSDIVPPESYTISGEGKGGAAGHARGGAEVRLLEDGDGTILNYNVTADIGGKLAQLGGRLIDSTARKFAGQFFETFGTIVEASAATPAGEAALTPAAIAAPDTGESTFWTYAVSAAAVAAALGLIIWLL